MKLLRLVALLMLVTVGVCATPAGAQGPVTLSIDDIQVDNLPEIRVLVTVRDANGVPISDLAAEQFQIVEDGRLIASPGEVTTQVNGDAVISSMLVVDVSGSMKGKPIDEAKRAASSFVDKLGPQDRSAIIAFGDRVDLDVDKLAPGKELGFTTDKNALRNVIALLDTKIGGDTPLYDAIYKGIALTARESTGKRAMIVMTDGRDERDNAKHTPVPNAGSLTAPDDPINEAARQGIPIFAIGLGAKPDAKYLSRLALRTGGQYEETPNPEELTALFQKVLDQLKQQYVLTYNSGWAADGSTHSLVVHVQAPQGQAFFEKKFLLGTPPAPTSEVVLVTITADPGIVAQAATATPEPEDEGFFAEVQNNMQDIIEDNPALAAAIGGGALLLIVLIIVLVVIVVRGRRARAEGPAPSVELEEIYAAPAMPAPDVPSRPAYSGPPVRDAATVGWDESAPTAWPGAGPGGGAAPPAWAQPGQPPAPWAGQPPAPAPGGGGFVQVPPPQEGTRVIQRAPRHLALLVSKTRSDQKYDLKDTLNVGRAPDNQVVVDHPTVSRHHAWIKEDKGEFLVFDVGSGNGTFVNDERIEAPRPLQHGDVVRFGEVEFVYTKVY